MWGINTSQIQVIVKSLRLDSCHFNGGCCLGVLKSLGFVKGGPHQIKIRRMESRHKYKWLNAHARWLGFVKGRPHHFKVRGGGKGALSGLHTCPSLNYVPQF